MPNSDNATPPVTVDVESMDDCDEIAAPPTKEERLMADIKQQNKTIRALQRRLGTMTKANARLTSANRRRQTMLDSQKRKWKELQKAQRLAETNAGELAVQNRKLRFERNTDEEVRKLLTTVNKEFKEAWEIAEQKFREKRFEELKKAIGCDVLVTRVQPAQAAASTYERKEDLNGIHSSMTKQLKQVLSQSKNCKPTRIEYILNDELYHRYKEAEAKLKAAGRPVDERLIFHGTREENIDAYDSPQLTPSSDD
jgi:bisphosphoglycerate-dependent phosphoglycerate mutase